MSARQQSLFGREAPAFDPRFSRVKRIALDDRAWVDRVSGWVAGHETLYTQLEQGMRWHAQRREMYERVVDVPRLLASVPDDGQVPLLVAMAAALSERYGLRFRAITLALYRDGRDSVAWHRDRELRDLDEARVAVVSLGGPRRFGLRPLGGGEARYFSVGWGDLVVMGGSCQRDWEHAVPKVRHAPPRMAVMFRP